MFKFVNSLGKEIEFDYSFPYFIEKHTGLTGLTSNISKSKGYREDGCILNGHTYKERDIDFYIVAQGDDDLELTMLKTKAINTLVGEGTLYYYGDDGETLRIIKGYIQDTPKFSEISGAYCERFQFSILCPDPYFHDVIENRVNMGQWISNLQFPINIPSTKMQLGYKDTSVIKSIYVEGDAPCPIRIEMLATDVVTNPYFENITTGERICLETTLGNGEKIVLNTEKGNKSVKKTLTDGIESNIIYTLSLDTTLFQLQPGDNLIKIGATNNINFLQAFLYYNNNYGGIICN